MQLAKTLSYSAKLLSINDTKILLVSLIYGFFMSCSNNPYPNEEQKGKVLYTTFKSAVKNLDPQQSYTMVDLAYLRLCYEPLVDYHYLDSQKLVPALAKTIPEPQISKDKDGNISEVRYSFSLRRGVHFIDDPCFEEGKGRELTAYDFEYAFKRVADPATNCPIYDSLSFIKGFEDFGKQVSILREMKQAGKEFQQNTEAYINTATLYKDAGKLPGVEVTGKYSFDLILSEKYPQILYWLAMRFVPALAHEAVDYYHPENIMKSNEPVNFNLRAVGTGPYKFLWSEFRKSQKVTMVKNQQWWGQKVKSPISVFPSQKPADARPIALPDRIVWYKESESLTKFNKFMQGYYDVNILPPEKVNEALAGQELTEDMKARGIKMNKSVELSIRYIGFNMQDSAVGTIEDKEQSMRNKKLRQALNLALNSEEFIRVHLKGMGINAQSPLPPGINGYDPEYKNPFKYKDNSSLDKARQLLSEAGYKDGIDPKTGKPLELSFTVAIKSAEDENLYQFFIDCWQQIGVNVKLDKNEFNQFQKKVYGMNYQMYYWSWAADYPDPENFLFILYSKNFPTPNHSEFNNPQYDKYFKLMETMADGETRTWMEKDSQGKTITKKATREELIRKCIDIFAEETPWIMVYHDVYFQLYHDWVKDVKNHPLFTYPYHYYDIDTERRQRKRAEWNKKSIWPLYALSFGFLIFISPALLTYYRERN